MKTKAFLFQSVILLSLLISKASHAQPDTEKFPFHTLKESPAYKRDQARNIPEFTYQDSSATDLARLRKSYHLDQIAGTGSDLNRAENLLNWFHEQVPHQDVTPLDTLTAENILATYKNRKIAQGCYPLAIAMNEVFLSMGFKSRVVICFSDKFPEPQGGHVINTVFIPSLHKWIYMDPQDNAFVSNEHGELLSIPEVRERLISGQPLQLNERANYHGIKTNKEDYLYTFMMEHLYRMISPLHSCFSSETRSPGKTLEYVELIPYGNREPIADGYETSKRKDYKVISYHTSNDNLFWQNPSL